MYTLSPSKLVGNISCGRCGVIQDVYYGKSHVRKRMADQRDVDIGKAADAVSDAVAQTEYLCEELSTKIRSVSLLKFRERAVFPKCETSEGLCAKARDFKLMCSIDCNNYLEGTRCFANEIKGRDIVFSCLVDDAKG